MAEGVGVVVIGRNEGERLRRCLESVRTASPAAIVYVDSGSTDGSVLLARGMNIEVVELDMRRPFTAARGRNAGFDRLLATRPDLPYVQFVDGDCELHPEWLGRGSAALAGDPQAVIVAGWLREREPGASIYNRLADLEWNFSGVGEVDYVGGVFLARAGAIAAVGGFDAAVAAGEEPELCARLRGRGGRIRRIDAEMGTHDLAMMHFGQWWRRMLRFGYGSLDIARRFDLRPFGRANLRARLWGAWLLIALALAGLAFVKDPPSLLGTLAGWVVLWPAQLVRIARKRHACGIPLRRAAAYAFFVLLSNFPHLAGQAWCWLDRLRGRDVRLVEHKVPAPDSDKAKAS